MKTWWLLVGLLGCERKVIVLDVDAALEPIDAIHDGRPRDAKPLTICDEARMRSDFVWIERVLGLYCATAGCHSGPEAEVDLRLDAGHARANLVNRDASTVGGWTRVVPGSPNSSYLVVALGRAPGPPPPDGFMPLGQPALCVEIHEAIERWITAGAP